MSSKTFIINKNNSFPNKLEEIYDEDEEVTYNSDWGGNVVNVDSSNYNGDWAYSEIE